MRLPLLPLFALALTGAAVAEEATQMRIPESTFQAVEIAADDAVPPRFTLVLAVELPSPGWTHTIDAVDTDEAERRIVARVTAAESPGMHAQVITPAKLRIPLGPVAPGPWVFELRTRRSPNALHVPAFATVLTAAR
jgi:hypothetical protein